MKMSVNSEFDNLQKKIEELEKELASLIQKEQTMKKSMLELGGKVAGRLEEKVEAKKGDLEKLESTQKDLERKLAELQEPQEASTWPSEPLSKFAEKEEESPKQVIEVAAGGSQQLQPEERKETHKEDKKRKWI